MKTGKTLVITGAYEVDIKEYPVPEAADDGMVIQVEAALICGSDGHFIKVNPESPFCDGHEFAGRIVSIGKNANRFIHCYGGDLKLGDRIAVYPHITCGNAPAACHMALVYAEYVMMISSMAGLPPIRIILMYLTQTLNYILILRAGLGNMFTYTRKPLYGKFRMTCPARLPPLWTRWL